MATPIVSPKGQRIGGVEALLEKLGNLAKQGKEYDRDLVVGYHAPYAVYVHERLDIPHPNGGEAKYLEKPTKLLRKKMQEIVRNALKAKKTMAQALTLAGEFLLKESQVLVPVDTGFLRSSGFVRLDK